MAAIATWCYPPSMTDSAPKAPTPAQKIAALAKLWPGTQPELAEACSISRARMIDFMARAKADDRGEAYVSPSRNSPPSDELVERVREIVRLRLAANSEQINKI